MYMYMQLGKSFSYSHVAMGPGLQLNHGTGGQAAGGQWVQFPAATGPMDI